MVFDSFIGKWCTGSSSTRKGVLVGLLSGYQAGGTRYMGYMVISCIHLWVCFLLLWLRTLQYDFRSPSTLKEGYVVLQFDSVIGLSPTPPQTPNYSWSRLLVKINFPFCEITELAKWSWSLTKFIFVLQLLFLGKLLLFPVTFACLSFLLLNVHLLSGTGCQIQPTNNLWIIFEQLKFNQW